MEKDKTINNGTGNEINGGYPSAYYARASTERQEKENTIASQKDAIEQAIAKNGDVLVKKYEDDGYTGSLLERPGLDDFRNDLAKGLFKRVYFYDPDRIARKSHYAAIVIEDIQKHGIEIFFLNKPMGDSMEDKLLFGIRSLFADYEKAKIADRMRRGKLFKIGKGTVLGNTPPYGYRYVKEIGTKNGWYEIDEKEAEVVRFIFSHYTSGECTGIGGVRKILYERNIKTRGSSTKWSQSTVCRILTNETYATGLTYWGKNKSVEGKINPKYRRVKNSARVRRPKEEWLPVGGIKVPLIIDTAIFEKAKRLRVLNNSRSTAKAKYEYLLRGLTKHDCGSPLYSKSCHGSAYYYCASSRNNFPANIKTCSNDGRHYRGESLDNAVWTEFRKILLTPEMLLYRIKQKNTNQGKALDGLETQLNGINAKIANLQVKRSRPLEAYMNGAMTIDQLKSVTADIDLQINSLTSAKAEIEDKISNATDRAPEITDLEKFTKQMENALAIASTSFTAKRNIVMRFIKEVTITEGEGMVLGYLPGELICVPASTQSISWVWRTRP